MQARFLAWLGTRPSAALEINALKHQHSLFPWLSPHSFGSPHVGHLLGSTSLAIGRRNASTTPVNARQRRGPGSRKARLPTETAQLAVVGVPNEVRAERARPHTVRASGAHQTVRMEKKVQSWNRFRVLREVRENLTACVVWCWHIDAR